ncbi:MAG TPA: RagB/SusD family nutrient uptake outer membrane protein [Gemmatimonadales bacterium]|nr:RagB/SusD family nutrient uptake outer membrane protein [Gemmatimonadales bacterium]
MNRLVKLSIGAAGLVSLLALGCTNLDETPASLITPGNFFRNQQEVLAGLAGVYAQLRAFAPEGGIYDVSEITTDEDVVPTRGQDWYDNGQWIDLHNMTWTPTSAATANFFNGVWNNPYQGIARANLFLSAVQNSSVPNKAAIVAEARVLRGYFYYVLMDYFGGVPIVTSTAIATNPRNTRREVFDFIETELLAARADLPATRPQSENGRITQGAVDAILANMYLNAGVFTKDAGISGNSYNTCSGVNVTGGDACTQAIAMANSILNSGSYHLADSFPQNFRADNSTSPENIFVVKFIAADGLGMDYVMSILHYSQFNPSPWNGFATLAQTYAAFDPADKRRQVFLIGPQKDVLTGAPVNDRAGNPLFFTESIPDIHSATEGQGPRIYKWPADPAHVQQNNGNDFALFRLGEIYLIKAEAEWASGNSPGALADLNTLRARTDPVAAPLAAVDPAGQTILSERLFELVGEGKRRQDLIRFGQYTGRTDDASGIAGGKQAQGDFHVLMPIPQTQIDANPKLTQNPGY